MGNRTSKSSFRRRSHKAPPHSKSLFDDVVAADENEGRTLTRIGSGPNHRPPPGQVCLSPAEEAAVERSLAEHESEWYLTAEQKKTLRESWLVLQANIESVGTVTFLKMFETHPETLKPFIPEVESLREIELNEWYRENLKVHAIRVMAVIEKAMHRLDDEKRAAQILYIYGRRHHSYGVTGPMLEKMANSFLIAIQPSLEERWSKKVEEAWLSLFARICFFMSLGYPQQQQKQIDVARSAPASEQLRSS